MATSGNASAEVERLYPTRERRPLPGLYLAHALHRRGGRRRTSTPTSSAVWTGGSPCRTRRAGCGGCRRPSPTPMT